MTDLQPSPSSSSLRSNTLPPAAATNWRDGKLVETRRKTIYDRRRPETIPVEHTSNLLEELRAEREREAEAARHFESERKMQEELELAEAQKKWTYEQWAAFQQETLKNNNDDDIDIRWFLEAPPELLPRMLPPRSHIEKAQQIEEEMLLAEIEEFFFEIDEKKREKDKKRKRAASIAAAASANENGSNQQQQQRLMEDPLARVPEQFRPNPLLERLGNSIERQLINDDDLPLPPPRRRKYVPAVTSVARFKPADPDTDSPERLGKLFKRIKIPDENGDIEFDSDDDVAEILTELSSNAEVMAQAAQRLHMEKLMFQKQQEQEERDARLGRERALASAPLEDDE